MRRADGVYDEIGAISNLNSQFPSSSAVRTYACATNGLVSELRDGRLRLAAPGAGHVELTNVAVRITVRRGRRRVSWRAQALEARGDGFVASWPEQGLRVILNCQHGDGASTLNLRIENRGAGAVAIEEVAPLCVATPGAVRIGGAVEDWSVFRNGYQSWSGTRAYAASQADADPWWRFLRISQVDVRHRAASRAGRVRSDLCTVIKNLRSGECLALGFLDSRDAFGAIVVDVRGGRSHELAATVDYDGVELRPGACLTVPSLWLAAGFDAQGLLATHAGELGGAMGARVQACAPVGWCSWYCYFTHVSEATVLQNLEALDMMRQRFRCDYVMIDDGYQRAVGDWLDANEKFPHGMRWLSERIRARGFEAGIWLAPFIARPESQLFHQRPDWFVRTRHGRRRSAVWNPTWSLWRSAYALDTTHPEVLQWLRELAHTVVHEWGYRILKLDFLFAAAVPGLRHDAGATRAQALRRGLEALRAGAGEEAFLIGCGCPLGPAVGIVDAMRIGPDVSPYWSNWLSRGPFRGRHGVATKHAVRNALTRAFMHRRLWLNDPDCLMVRGEGRSLTLEELRSLAAVIMLTGGMLVISDRMHRLAAGQLALLEQACRFSGAEVRTVVDLFEHDLPELVLSEHAGSRLVGVFNFSDGAREKSVNVGQFGIREGSVQELCGGRDLVVRDGLVRLGLIPAHGGRILRLEPEVGEGGELAPHAIDRTAQ